MNNRIAILEKLIALEKEAQRYGFDWPDPQMVIDHAISECEEIKDAIKSGDKKDIQSEIGDLIHVSISLCIFLGYDVHETIYNSFKKFHNRMSSVKEEADKLGLESLEGQSIDFMLSLWNKAKDREEQKGV